MKEEIVLWSDREFSNTMAFNNMERNVCAK